jgi:2-oxoglutarate ferredoxin oxidoreductase subunit delta
MADVSRPKVRGTVVIRPEQCKGCAFCVEFCPTDVLGLSAGFNAKGYHPPEIVRPEACSGCDLCGMYCPDFAIYGYRL